MSSAIARRRIDTGKHQAEIRCYAKAKERSRGLYTTAGCIVRRMKNRRMTMRERRAWVDAANRLPLQSLGT